MGIKTMIVKRKDLTNYLTNHFIDIYQDYLPEKNEIKKVDYKSLLSPKRFDIAIKYIYAWHKQNGIDIEYATEVYRHHIGIWNNFVEGDGSKNCFTDYLDVFDHLIDHPFNPECSLIPVGSDGVIMDGSHRATACLVNKVDPHVIVIDKPAAVYDYNYFRKLGTDEKILDHAALNYAELDDSLYLLFLYPIARGKDKNVENAIEKYAEIVYAKEIHLSEQGMHNLIIQSYRDEHWIGTKENNFAGAKKNAQNKYKAGAALQTYLIKPKKYEDTLEIKKQIRGFFTFGNNAVHITDNHEQTLRLAQQIYNENSVYFLNSSVHLNNDKFSVLFQKYRQKYYALAFEKRKFYCIDSSSVLAAYGIRDARDIDFLAYENDVAVLEENEIDCHNEELKHYLLSLESMIFDPKNYFYYDGVKFLTLENVKKMKLIRCEEKDIKDVQLIDNFIQRLKKEESQMERWYSQNGEDFILNELFKDKQDGFFVEVGCIDGLRFSNTYKLEQKGWKGICVEAHQDYVPLLKKNRPNSIVLDYAVGEKDEDDVVFYANSRGSLSTLDKSQEERWKKSFPDWFSGFKEQIVQKRTLNTIFDECNVETIDILSLDIEGYEFEALMGLDLKKYKPSIIVVESFGENHECELDEYLLQNQYKKLFRISENIFYSSCYLMPTLKKQYEINLITTENPFDLEGDLMFSVELRLQETPSSYYEKLYLNQNRIPKNLYIKNRIYTKDFFSQQKRIIGHESNRLIFDVGANKGNISELYMRLFPDYDIHAFEPFPNAFTFLEENLFNSKIHLNPFALGSFDGQHILNVSDEYLFRTFLDISDNKSIQSTKTIETTVMTIDSYCEKNDIERIDVLFIDTKGYEYEVLEGAKSMLLRNKISLIALRTISEKIHPRQKSFAQISDLLDGYGYRLLNIYNQAEFRIKGFSQMDSIFIINNAKLQ